MANFDISGARFNDQLRMLETTDPVHADLMNSMFGQLIKNDVAMRDAVSVFAKSKNEQALFLLNLRRRLIWTTCSWWHLRLGIHSRL